MSAEVKRKIKSSAEAFESKLWPQIQSILGGGRIVSVESVSDQDFFKQCLDAYGGIDTWHVDDGRCLIRGLATRMQRTARVFRTITIRYRRMSGASTEIHKRMKALQEPGNWLHPSLVIQGYFEPTENGYGPPKAVAVARMEDVIRVILDGKQGSDWRDKSGDWYIDKTSQKYGNRDNTEFAVIPVASLEQRSMKVKWLEF